MDNLFDLPPLPLAAVATSAYSKDSAMRLFYTADQMQAYARAAVEAEREACAQVGFRAAMNGIEVAAAIRERGKS